MMNINHMLRLLNNSSMRYLVFFIIVTFIGCNAQSEKNDTIRNRYEGYTLVWHDEFENEGMPDSSKWSFDTKGNEWDWGNNELQYYTDHSPKNVAVDSGTLKIVAIKEPIANKSYSSTRLISLNKGDWKYGRIDIKAKLPKGRGLWPALWMLPSNNKYGQWPKSGEIDIMEHVGHNPDTVFATAHTEKYNHMLGTQKTIGVFMPHVYNDFHEYSLEWTPENYKVYFDGKAVFTFENEHTSSAEWPFDQPFHIIMNLAVGGGWGGQKGVAEDIFPATFEIDYVRVYQK